MNGRAIRTQNKWSLITKLYLKYTLMDSLMQYRKKNKATIIKSMLRIINTYDTTIKPVANQKYILASYLSISCSYSGVSISRGMKLSNCKNEWIMIDPHKIMYHMYCLFDSFLILSCAFVVDHLSGIKKFCWSEFNSWWFCLAYLLWIIMKTHMTHIKSIAPRIRSIFQYVSCERKKTTSLIAIPKTITYNIIFRRLISKRRHSDSRASFLNLRVNWLIFWLMLPTDIKYLFGLSWESPLGGCVYYYFILMNYNYI
jgi:hypothetical protein